MDPIDAPVQLNYNNGNNFPPNFVIIAYVVLAASLLLALTGTFILGGILLLLTLLVVSNRHIVIINTEQNFIHDHSLYLGFIKVGKKYPLDKYKYITTMPLIESQQVYASTSNSTTISNSYTTITFFGDRFKGKRIITKFDSKNQAEEVAEKLAERLNLKYFQYDPQLVREVLLGQRTL